MDAAPGVQLYSDESTVSFPYWYDPSRFESPVRPTVSVANQWRTLKANARWFRIVGGAFALLCLLALGISARRRQLAAHHVIAVTPALALVAMHALTHPEGRLAGSAIVCSLAMVVYWRGRHRATSPRHVMVVSEIVIPYLIPALVMLRLHTDGSLREQPSNLAPDRDLIQAGVPPGSRIGLLASPYGQYWAHQLGLRISVAGEPAGMHPIDRELLVRIAEESCDRGAPLAAILWRRPPGAQGTDAIELSGGWLAWRPSRPCARRS
jgi:hypothetical protein